MQYTVNQHRPLTVLRQDDRRCCLRLAYLGLSNTFALVRLLPMSTQDKDTEFLGLRHQIGVLQTATRRYQDALRAADRALLAALRTAYPRPILHRLRLLVHPDTIPALAPQSAPPTPTRRCRDRHARVDHAPSDPTES